MFKKIQDPDLKHSKIDFLIPQNPENFFRKIWTEKVEYINIGLE